MPTAGTCCAAHHRICQGPSIAEIGLDISVQHQIDDSQLHHNRTYVHMPWRSLEIVHIDTLVAMYIVHTRVCYQATVTSSFVTHLQRLSCVFRGGGGGQHMAHIFPPRSLPRWKATGSRPSREKSPREGKGEREEARASIMDHGWSESVAHHLRIKNCERRCNLCMYVSMYVYVCYTVQYMCVCVCCQGR